MRYRKLAAILPLALVLIFGWTVARVSATVPGVNEHADLTSGGSIGNGTANGGSMSHDGRYVAFTSAASNLVTGDTNGKLDVFVRDRVANTVTRASVSSSGTQGNDDVLNGPSISDDGRYVVFTSWATNLVSGDTNGIIDVFVHDMQTGATTLVDSSSGGTEGNNGAQDPVISGDGKFVAFDSTSTNLVSPSTTTSRSHIYVKNLQTGAIQLITKTSGGVEANNSSYHPSISCDGGVVAFDSYASNLVANDNNATADIFVDTRAGGDSITNVTLGSNNGAQWPVISCDGMHLAFTSLSTNLVASDTNGKQDIFTYDRRNQTTQLVSVDSSGSQANSGSSNEVISADGRLVAFTSDSTNLATGANNGYSQVFMRDTLSGTTYLISMDPSGTQGNNSSFTTGNYTTGASFSGNSKYLYFTSYATNLISGDTSNVGSGYIAETGL